MNKVVRAIDLGYGLNKFVQSINADGTMNCMHYPSLAVASDPKTMSAINFRHRKTVDVTVGNAQFEVGPDVLQAQTGNDVGREIGENWSRAPNYRAVMLGALHYMNVPHIDVLVLGLPVNQYLSEDRCAELAKAYTGKIDLPQGKSVQIDHVEVRPQPFGGYVDLANHVDELNSLIETKSKLHKEQEGVEIGIQTLKNADDIMDNLCVLVVDPGEYTLDWLLVERGNISTKASGAASDSGRHRIVSDVVRAMENDLNRTIAPANFSRINEALRTGSPLKLGGQIVDIKKYSYVVAQSVADPISRLIEGLRGLEDRIDVILLVGGHPAIYEEELTKRFPFVPVFLPKETLYANVRGFQSMGEAIANS